MSAYLIFTREKTLDRAQFEIYWSHNPRNAKAPPSHSRQGFGFQKLWGQDLNLRPSGYESEVADRAGGRLTCSF